MTSCIYYKDGYCAKGLPNTPCERKGCSAYYPVNEAYRCEDKECLYYGTFFGLLPQGVCDKVNCTDRIPPIKDKKI